MRGGLTEREGVLAAVAETLQRARTGRGSSLLIVGEAGTGKTAVLNAAIQDAEADMEVALVRGDPMETGIAWGVLEQVMRAIGTDVSGPTVEPSGPYLHAIRQLEDRRDQPLLIAVDDLHWADADSLQVLAFLTRRLRPLPVTLIATLRPWPRAAHDIGRALATARHSTLVTLAPLSPDGSRALLEAQHGAPASDADATRAWELCRGNPLLIEQFAATLGTTPAPTGPMLTDGLPVARFAGLDEQTVTFARAASVMGVRFWPQVAGTLAEQSPAAVDRALHALHHARLVVDGDDGRLRFSHPLFVQALYEELPPALRRRLHGRAFAQLDRLGRFREAAEHAVRANLVGDVRAAELLEEIGRTALMSGAIAAAERHLDAAVHLRGGNADPDVLLALAETHCASGQIEPATDVCRRALARPEITWEQRIAVLVLLGRCRYLAGDAQLGEVELEQAIEIAEQHDPVRAVIPLLDQAVSAWMAAGPIKALPLATRARALAQSGNRETQQAADAVWGHLLAETGDPRGIAATEPIAQAIRSDGHPAALRPAELVTPRASVYPYAHCAQYAERLDASLAALVLVRERVEAAGAAQALAVVSMFIANHLLRRGRLHEALENADRADRFSDLTPLVIPHAAMIRAHALLWLGRLDEADREAQRAEAAGPGLWMVALWGSYLTGLRQLWAGDPAASDAFLEVERISVGAGIGEPNHVQWASQAIAAHLLADRREEAHRVTVKIQQQAAVLPSRWPRFAALLGTARLAEQDGEDRAAIAGYRDAVEALGDVDLPLQRAEGLLAWGALLRRSGHLVRSRTQLAEALRIAEGCAAAPLADAARTELRLAGGRRRRPRDRDRLTPAELRVARRAASGLSNAEIARSSHLSVHTVETHLKHVYAKLGISGRRQLVGLMLDTDPELPEPHA